MDEIINCEVTEVTPEVLAQIEAMFKDEHLMRHLGGLAYPPSLGGDTEEAPPEVKLKRMQEAVDAFSKLPDSFWSFS